MKRALRRLFPEGHPLGGLFHVGRTMPLNYTANPCDSQIKMLSNG
jgi:hypothetical protein